MKDKASDLMAGRYLDFELQLDGSGEAGYKVSVVRSAVGELEQNFGVARLVQVTVAREILALQIGQLRQKWLIAV